MRVLVADDDEAVLLALELLLRREGIEVERAQSPAQVLARLGAAGAPSVVRAGGPGPTEHDRAGQHASQTGPTYDVLLLDLNYERDTTSGQEGFALLEQLRREHPALPVVVMTGWASIEGAVEAMRRGAHDYVPKPWNNTKLVQLIRDLSHGRPAQPLSAASSPHESPALQELRATIERVAFSDVPILVTGEHGSGKELVARSIHERSGRRGRFVAVNAGALADGTFESELFGHVRGAFTDAKSAREGAFALAQHGTLFLDELANMPLAQQAKLLRVVQERQYQPLGGSTLIASTARVVSATNADIDALAREGHFRADLLYRLNTIRLHVPPLRERLGELPGLVQLFIQREIERYMLPVPELGPGVLERLAAHAWPGNVRELEHVIQRAVLLSAHCGRLGIEHLDLPLAATPSPATGAAPPAPTALPETVRDAEKAAILRALERFPDDRRAAAESLGLSRSAFYRRLSQYGIRPAK